MEQVADRRFDRLPHQPRAPRADVRGLYCDLGTTGEDGPQCIAAARERHSPAHRQVLLDHLEPVVTAEVDAGDALQQVPASVLARHLVAHVGLHAAGPDRQG